MTNGILLPKLVNVAALIKDCRYATARGYARRAVRSTTVMFLQPVIYFGRAFPNWRARVIPAIAISGFLAFVSKNPICFSYGSMSRYTKYRAKPMIAIVRILAKTHPIII